MTLPYDYYPAVLYAIDLMAQGRTKTKACDESNITIAILESYVKGNAELQDIFREAEQRSYDAMAEALVDIDNHKIHGQSDAKMAKVISDNIKWLLDKRRPKEYGQRVTIDHNITADKAITDALNAGRKRAELNAALGYTPGEIIDVIVEDVSEEAMLAEMLQ